MKLADIKPVQAKFYLKHPVTKEALLSDNGEEIYWDVVGQDSAQHFEAQQAFLKHLETMGDKAKALKPVDYRKFAVSQLTKLVLGWDEKFNDFHGGPYDQEALEKLLSSSDHRWVYDQLDSFVAKRHNFFE